jgi:hypothetical protein
MDLREKIIERFMMIEHFKDRINQRGICDKTIKEVILKGKERHLFRFNRIRYEFKGVAVVASKKSYALITAILLGQKTRQDKNKLKYNKKFNNGTGRSKRKSSEFRSRKINGQ